MTRVVLTGARGLLGRALRRAFADEGHDVIATTRDGAGADQPLDVADAARDADAALAAVGGFDALVNAAARPWVEGCERDPTGTRAVNVDGPIALARAAAARGAAFVTFSTEYVFSGERPEGYLEDDATGPLNVYGEQKLAVERAVAELPRAIAVRTSGLFGPDPAQKGFLSQLRAAAGEGRALRVPEDQDITPTDVDDLAARVCALLDEPPARVLHLAGGRILRRDAFARLACEQLGLPLATVQPVPTSSLSLAAARPRHAGLREERARELGLGPTLSLERALARQREPE